MPSTSRLIPAAWRADTEAEAALLDDQAPVFHVQQAGGLGDSTCLRRRDAKLQPQGSRTRRDSLSSYVCRLAWWPEDVD